LTKNQGEKCKTKPLVSFKRTSPLMHGHFQAKPVVKNLKWFSHLEKDNELCELCLMKNDVKLEMWIASCQPFSGNFFCTFSTEK
jgi:hypothetical protein